MLREYTTTRIVGLPAPAVPTHLDDERAAVERFADRVAALGPLSQASPDLQARLLEEVKIVARHVNGRAEAGVATGYGRRVLYEDPERWSLAAISLRPGQSTELHDHASWGCAVTVQGVERDRRFVPRASGDLLLGGERDYPAGTGYLFDPVDVHQPVGADPLQVTVALHFLVHDHGHHSAIPEILEFPQRYLEMAA
jgi:predicted metal-dependent enzyme (double-stranded beta helix superfamily)